MILLYVIMQGDAPLLQLGLHLPLREVRPLAGLSQRHHLPLKQRQRDFQADLDKKSEVYRNRGIEVPANLHSFLASDLSQRSGLSSRFSLLKMLYLEGKNTLCLTYPSPPTRKL